MPRLLLLISILLFSTCLIGQKEKVSFELNVKEAFIKVDGQLINFPAEKSIMLPPGSYRAEIWSPKFQIHEKEFSVVAGKSTQVVTDLRYQSEAYEEYVTRRQAFNTDKLKQTIGDGVFLLGTSALAFTAIVGKKGKLNDLEENILLTESNFIRAISEDQVQETGRLYTAAVTEYEETQKTHNQLVMVGSALAIASAAATVFYFKKWRRKLNKPVYTPNNPFANVMSKTTPFLVYSGQGGQVGINFSF